MNCFNFQIIPLSLPVTKVINLFLLMIIPEYRRSKKLWTITICTISGPVDCILVLGSDDLRVADRGAELYYRAWPRYYFSGLGCHKGHMESAEADQFARIALDKGVPAEAIFMRINPRTPERIQLRVSSWKKRTPSP